MCTPTLRPRATVADERARWQDKFEVGVDEMSWDDLGKNDEIWPT